MTVWRMIRCGGLKVLFKMGIKRVINLNDPINRIIKMLSKKHAPNPYVYLMLLAVDPKEQGKGHASTLVKSFLVFVLVVFALIKIR